TVDQEVVAVAFLQPARLDDDVSEARPWSDVDFSGLDLLCRVFLQQVLVRVEARLAFGLPGAWRHADPVELPRQRLLAFGLGLLFLRQAALFLLEPGRVVALPRDPPA